jgi:hypothetical protein
MALDASTMLETVARELDMPEDELLRQGLRTFLERRLKAARAEAFAIYGQYGVNSVEGMEARYREDTLEEDVSWRDLQRLDHLEYEMERLEQLLSFARTRLGMSQV